MDYFSHIVGQAQVVNLLKSSIDRATINHAYIFLGPEGIGKMLTALAFAADLLNRSDEDAHVYLKDNVHPDLLIIDKLEGKNLIGKEQISRDIEPWLALKPYRAAHRIVIIKNSHLLTLEAANALLKTLEEPPGYGVIILVADEYNLLETIVSRCQLIRFVPVPDADIEKLLIARGYEQDKAYRAARLAHGSIATALRFIEEAEFREIWEISRSIINDLNDGQVVEVYKSAERMEKDPELIVNMMETILRDMYIYQKTGDEKFLTIPDNLEFTKAAKHLDTVKMMTVIENLGSLKKYYRKNVNSLVINVNITYEIWQALN
ncbi:MAG: hypothetical protein PHT79_08845 [Syntrophomonadaceae bacterium]|nr:hypothetical protein [Syntrophomonadaceae bacterium]MDD3890034.1 hypothetical protein [Syntrophomonadaceae bacterium]MDD4549847.1 hypothetical protein [Syntrophomonadaceae bacterium]